MKRENQKARTRQNIKNAFVELLKVKHIDQITVTELARNADVDRKTFYLYYATVYDVVKEIENGVIAGLKEILEKNHPADWKVFLRGLNEIMEKDIGYYTVIAKNKNLSFLVDECTDILTTMLMESLLEEKTDIDDADRIRIKYAASGILGVYEEWLQSDDRMELDELIDILGEAMNDTLCHKLH